MALRVLIVDDTRLMRMRLIEIVRQLGHEVVGGADNDFQAVQMYKALKPDLVFIDISMPGMNGAQTLQQIKALNRQAVIILCLTVNRQEGMKEAMELGASGYVLKPFKPALIQEVIEEVAPTSVSDATSELLRLYPELAGLEPAELQQRAAISRFEELPACRWQGQLGSRKVEYRASYMKEEQLIRIENIADGALHLSPDALRQLLAWMNDLTGRAAHTSEQIYR